MKAKKEMELAEKIAGEIVFSDNPGSTLRKWREIFSITQTEVARKMNVSSSVISDYESSRRKSPGIGTIRRIVQTFLEIDRERGSPTIRKYSLMGKSDAIIDIREFQRGVPLKEFMRKIKGRAVSTNEEALERSIYGYTFIDSVKTILEFDANDYLNVYGWSTERALIFTEVYFGRSPMIAVRVHPLKPGAVVYHNPTKIDPLAVKLADMENIPLIVTEMDREELLEHLSRI